jgi:hypothetical protein
MDEEMMIPQRPFISEIYSELPHRHSKNQGVDVRESSHAPGRNTPTGSRVQHNPPPEQGKRAENMEAAEMDVTKGDQASLSPEGINHPGSPPSVAGAYPVDHSGAGLGRSQFASHNLSDPGRPRFAWSRDIKARALPAGSREENVGHDHEKRSVQTSEMYLGESNAAEREERYEGWLEALEKLEGGKMENNQDLKKKLEPRQYLRDVDEREVKENFTANASYTVMEGFTGERPFRQRGEDADDAVAGVDDGILPAASDSFPVRGDPNSAQSSASFAFKQVSQQGSDEKPESRVFEGTVGRGSHVHATAHPTAPGLLRRLAQEADPFARLSEARRRYVENRQLVHENVALGNSPRKQGIGRIAEVALGRAAAVGLVSAGLSEIWYGQSVMSQLLGRWEGVAQVEVAIPQTRTAAAVVLALLFSITILEAVVSGLPPPSNRFGGVSQTLQLWIGRIMAVAFVGLILFEVQHSNRPALFWFIR